MWSHARTSQSGGQMPNVRVEGLRLSPPGAPHPYGYFPPITVRTLAFGLVPAEATITLAQLRQNVKDVDPGTPDGSPRPRMYPCPGSWKDPPSSRVTTVSTGKADLRITRLALDGVKVAVRLWVATPRHPRT